SQLWYDNTDSIRDRTAYAVEAGIQGIGFWALTYEGGDPEFWQMISEETDLGIDGGDTGGDGGDGGDGSGDNEPPIALAGLPLMAYPGDTIQLNGTPSYDPEGEALSYVWSQVSGPAVSLSGGQTAAPQFTAEEAGVHTFALMVSDGELDSSLDTVDIIVVSPDAGQKYGGGCSTSAAGGGLLLAMLAGLRRRKRA
ncbi:MAG: chitinase, partial [Myxococcota bacterium]